LPGAQYIFETCGERDNASTTACSRPPPPTTKTFITYRLFPTALSAKSGSEIVHKK